MCYGICKYEHAWTGECKLQNRYKPEDAECMQEYNEILSISEDDYEIDEIIRLADIERISEGEK